MCMSAKGQRASDVHTRKFETGQVCMCVYVGGLRVSLCGHKNKHSRNQEIQIPCVILYSKANKEYRSIRGVELDL